MRNHLIIAAITLAASTSLAHADTSRVFGKAHTRVLTHTENTRVTAKGALAPIAELGPLMPRISAPLRPMINMPIAPMIMPPLMPRLP